MKNFLIASSLVILPAIGFASYNYKAVNNSDGTVYRACGSATSSSLSSGSSVTFGCSGDARIYDSGGTNYDNISPGTCTGQRERTKIEITGSASDPTVSSSCEYFGTPR